MKLLKKQKTDFQVAKLITIARAAPKEIPFSTERFTILFEPSGLISVSSIISFAINTSSDISCRHTTLPTFKVFKYSLCSSETRKLSQAF